MTENSQQFQPEDIGELLSNHNKRNQLTLWQDLIRQWQALDEATFEQVGRDVFAQLARYNDGCKGKRGKLNKVNLPVLRLLKDTFKWPEKEQDYRQHFNNDKFCDAILGRTVGTDDSGISDDALAKTVMNNKPRFSFFSLLGWLFGAWLCFVFLRALLSAFTAAFKAV
jgi:hypothetical protein